MNTMCVRVWDQVRSCMHHLTGTFFFDIRLVAIQEGGVSSWGGKFRHTHNLVPCDNPLWEWAICHSVTDDE